MKEPRENPEKPPGKPKNKTIKTSEDIPERALEEEEMIAEVYNEYLVEFLT